MRSLVTAIYFISAIASVTACGSNFELKNYANEIDMDHPAYATSTVYYIPVYSEAKSRINCDSKDMKFVRDDKNQVIASLCEDEVSNCALQGSCYYATDDGLILFSYDGPNPIKNDQDSASLFSISNRTATCPQGVGIKNICLDPYRSIAADPAFHKAGDVIFIPSLVGTVLPNGEVHDGYFTVRDQGQAIKGQDRFDFFSGFDRPVSSNIYYRNGLSNKDSHILYYKVLPKKQSEVLVQRKFPLSLESVKQFAFLDLSNKVVAAMNAVEAASK
jgi:3D (Asp-Asp-Asp) domain-containing protein